MYNSREMKKFKIKIETPRKADENIKARESFLQSWSLLGTDMFSFGSNFNEMKDNRLAFMCRFLC